MINTLSYPDVWREYLEYKMSCEYTSEKDIKRLSCFIEQRDYLTAVQVIKNGGTFAPPKKSEISKIGTNKKRVVYTYADDENMVLKLLNYLLQKKYDHIFADNLYSFRKQRGVYDAVKKMTRHPNINNMWGYKIDISNYFNSVPVDKMIDVLKITLVDEPDTLRFLKSLLTNRTVRYNGSYIEESKGIMAGTSVSNFLANLYLSHIDHYFQSKNILYARYSDDIIVFDSTEDKLNDDVKIINNFLKEAGLNINPEKENYYSPREKWVFLGISYCDGIIDVAPVSVEKLKAKMRRKTRALTRWAARKNVSGENAAKAFIRIFNRKLFDNTSEHELTWSRWYFPLINTTQSLKIIDEYSQSCIRYLVTGKRTKSAYNCRYKDMKKLGYITLVNRYYNDKKEG
ncbi:MAG: hypothetical protein IKU25_06550 [Clostridia bacterium]|nr:hypothetical protein [Clostridia bacterium]